MLRSSINCIRHTRQSVYGEDSYLLMLTQGRWLLLLVTTPWLIYVDYKVGVKKINSSGLFLVLLHL